MFTRGRQRNRQRRRREAKREVERERDREKERERERMCKRVNINVDKYRKGRDKKIQSKIFERQRKLLIDRQRE